MPAVLRALPLALVGWFASLPLGAQEPPLPPIFAPRPVQPAVAPAPSVALARPASRAGLSDRVRSAMSERILAEARTFPQPGEAAAPNAGMVGKTSGGALLMPRFLVKAIPLRREEVEPPALPLMRFSAIDRLGDRRLKPAQTATLLRLFGGQGTVNFSVLNGAGTGADHGNDFTRVELDFTWRW